MARGKRSCTTGLGALRSPNPESPSIPPRQALGSEAGCCLTAALPTAIPVIRAISRLPWKIPLPGEGVRALLRGDRKLKRRKRKCRWLVEKHCLLKFPQSIISLARADHMLCSQDCVFCLQRNARLGMTNTTSKPSTAEMSPKSLPHRTCDYHKWVFLTCCTFNW